MLQRGGESQAIRAAAGENLEIDFTKGHAPVSEQAFLGVHASIRLHKDELRGEKEPFPGRVNVNGRWASIFNSEG